MSVLGFSEAHASGDIISLQTDPAIEVRVATPVGMALLKFIAWMDRHPDMRSKDAKGLLYILGNYSRVPEVLDVIYADAPLAEPYEWDVDLMSANLLGRRGRAIATSETARAILEQEDPDRLLWESSVGLEEVVERHRALLTAYLDGFRLAVA